MASNNPTYTAADVITDVEIRLGSPSISASNYLPWISYAYQKTWGALSNAGQTVREQLFGAYTSYTLTNGTAEYTLTDIAPRFDSVVKMEILYGGTGDLRVPVTKMRSVSNWKNMGNVSTSYQNKGGPIYYQFKNTLGIIPTPPASDSSQAILYLWYIQRPYQINATNDEIDIPYRFIYPILNYVQAKAMQAENEDYTTAGDLEARFERELEQVALTASSEMSEDDGTLGVESSANDLLYDNPLSY